MRTFLLLCAAGGSSILAINSSGVRAAAGTDGIRIAPAARASTVSRSRLAGEAVSTVRIDIDGIPAPVDLRTGSTVADALARLGIALGPADILSMPLDTVLAEGSSVVLDRGVPVTLIDGGVPSALRSPKGSVADLLGLYGVAIGAKDVVDRPIAAPIAAGDVVRITRIAEREAMTVVPQPFAVRYEDDATVDKGTETVARAGVEGQVAQTWLVRYVDGVEASRTLVASAEVRAAIEEVRVRGTRVRVSTPVYSSTPLAPADIRAIIIAAAARWGANADQLLRVAYCESGYNPNAYNGILGASGLFQIIPSTWAANSVRAGYGGASVFDPVANANVAAYMFANGQAGQWVCK